MRLQLRERVRQLKVPLEQPYRKLLVDYLNLVFGESAKSTRYWNEKLKSKLQHKYPRALTTDESAAEHDLKKMLLAPAWGGKIGRCVFFSFRVWQDTWFLILCACAGVRMRGHVCVCECVCVWYNYHIAVFF